MQCGNKIPYGFYKKINTQWTTIFIVYSCRSWFIVSTNRLFSLFFFQLSENMYRKRPSPNGLIPTLPESIVGWQISTLILGMANSLLNFWKSSLVKDWYVFPVCLFSKLFDYIIVVSHSGSLQIYFIQIVCLGIEISGFM